MSRQPPRKGPFRHLKVFRSDVERSIPHGSLSPAAPAQPVLPLWPLRKTDPLRREFGLKLLTEPLPEPLRTFLIRSWRRPGRHDGKQAIQSLHRQRPDEAALPLLTPGLLGIISLTELEVSRRVVEMPRTSISRETRNKLLAAQGVYLRCLFAALVFQLGEAAALAEFQGLLLKVG